MPSPSETAALIESESEEIELPFPEFVRKTSRKRSLPSGGPKYAFRNIHRILARLREAQKVAFLLDCDGTLVPLRRHPAEVRVPAQVKEVLGRLVGNPSLFVAIVSGRKVRDLKALLNVKGLHYVGLHGAESARGKARVARASIAALRAAKRAAARNLLPWPGIWVEDKGLAFSVHYRQAKPAAKHAASLTLAELLKPSGDALHVLYGSRVWEVLPKEVEGKSSAVLGILKGLPRGTPAIYIGDDGTDELAFNALAGQITIRVGQHRATHARYYVRTPSDVVRFLALLEKQLRE